MPWLARTFKETPTAFPHSGNANDFHLQDRARKCKQIK
ncbi:hypothetical protein MICA_1791 [Micavibrio aeruginosavorus ARL-13]|uniref:Uncharacterized protein n=1 Tax=Micavibrio aeruginosavorus (strain ARL-13) TaxID=856793 RepID=G2KSV7_MICAA|nr:hypothetical protein MICA_1791 [Micavibrio aeruginosavorus ARL-13]